MWCLMSFGLDQWQTQGHDQVSDHVTSWTVCWETRVCRKCATHFGGDLDPSLKNFFFFYLFHPREVIFFNNSWHDRNHDPLTQHSPQTLICCFIKSFLSNTKMSQNNSLLSSAAWHYKKNVTHTHFKNIAMIVLVWNRTCAHDASWCVQVPEQYNIL